MLQHDDPLMFEAGVPSRLAVARRGAIERVRYALRFRIPSTPSDPIDGQVTADIRLSAAARGTCIALDFAGDEGDISRVRVDGLPGTWRLQTGHLIIDHPAHRPDREVRVDVDFRVPAGGLHRRDGLAYSLFVPARAHRAFPCFDQPDLKAAFALTLEVPKGWTTVTNAEPRSTQSLTGADAWTRVEFAETAPIPTYLFAFAAGLFAVERGDGPVPFRIFHQDADAASVRSQAPEIARQHAAALRWLHEYTGYPYAYGKLDIVLIPGFPFGGMEHPGAIFYEPGLLLLGPSPSEDHTLGRAGLIAHETAHMWFGNLVTIPWFDDVWLKEVFATFLSSRMLAAWFPAIDHDVRFLLYNYPAAYDIDRTGGSHPIRQPLENLEDAGSLYGSIIYRKAPIVLRQLEWMVGAGRFRDVVQEYVRRFAHGTAGWTDLLTLFAAHGFDADRWSRAWIETAGRPTVALADVAARGTSLSSVSGSTSFQVEEVWVDTGHPQRFDVGRLPGVDPDSDVVLPSGRRPPYGACIMNSASRTYALAHMGHIDDPALRGATWMALWDDVLDGRLGVEAFLTAAEQAIPVEAVEQVMQFLATQSARACWRFVPSALRRAWAARLESAWSAAWSRWRGTTRATACFWAYQAVAVSEAAVRRLTRVLDGDGSAEGLALGEHERVTVALGMAVTASSRACLDDVARSLSSPEERARLALMRRAVSQSRFERDQLFASFRDASARTREPWVIEAVALLNHPLRAADSLHYVEPGLRMLPELQRTGDIFLPKRWCDALLHGHSGTTAVATVRRVADDAGLSVRLRRTLLQSADDLFRAARLETGQA